MSTENLPEFYTDFEGRNSLRNRLILCRFLEGQSAQEIADFYQVVPETIHAVLRRPEIQKELARLSSSAVTRVEGLADEAVDTIRDTMRGEQRSELRFKAATGILDRHPEFRKKGDVKEALEGLGEGMVRAIQKAIREEEQQRGADNARETSRIEVGTSEGTLREIVVSDDGCYRDGGLYSECESGLRVEDGTGAAT